MRLSLRSFACAQFALSLGVVAGCFFSRPNDNHCAYNGGDAACPTGQFCVTDACGAYGADNKTGCIDEDPNEVQAFVSCYAKCSENGLPSIRCESGGSGTTTSGNLTGSATETEATSGPTTEDTGPPPECEDDGDCPTATPFCGTQGTCVDCFDFGQNTEERNMACASLGDGELPVCLEEQGCVECVVSTDCSTEDEDSLTPICTADNVCTGCTSHAQCPVDEPDEDGAGCNLFTGACLPSDRVFVAAAGDPGSITDAVNDIGAGNGGTILVTGSGMLTDSVDVGSDRTIAILVETDSIGLTLASSPRWEAGAGQSALVVDDATVLLRGVVVEAEDDAVLRASSSAVWLDQVRIVPNNEVDGLVVENGADVRVYNSFLASGLDANVVQVQGGNAEFVYTTIAANFGDGLALECDSAASGSVRNSVVVKRGGAAVSCDALSFVTSTNTMLQESELGWFAAYNTGDLHLTGAGVEALDGAIFVEGDPTVDVDNQPRRPDSTIRGADEPDPR